MKVTRRLYRDATSEYLINNQMSRLKDIRELFLDTGIGVDAYSLIEQGRVAAFLDSNSQDRREIFEEAAGISRFKQRKKEALRKLERTDQNLAQSQLVLDEVEKQLRSVKVQAGRARSYQEYSARLKELRSAYVMQEYDGLHKKVVALGDQLADVVDNLAAVRRRDGGAAHAAGGIADGTGRRRRKRRGRRSGNCSRRRANRPTPSSAATSRGSRSASSPSSASCSRRGTGEMNERLTAAHGRGEAARRTARRHR